MDKDEKLFNRIHRLMKHGITQKVADLRNKTLESDPQDAESIAGHGKVLAALEGK